MTSPIEVARAARPKRPSLAAGRSAGRLRRSGARQPPRSDNRAVRRGRPAWLATLLATAAALGIGGPPAQAKAPLGLSDCGRTEGGYQCSGLVRTWDGIPLDTT